MKWLVLAALVLLTPRTGEAEFRSLEVESLRITIDTDWGTRAAPGYLPVRFDITNLTEARVIEVIGQGARYSRTARFGAWANARVVRSIRLARGDRVRFTMSIPISAESENYRFEIQENGKTLQSFGYSGIQSATPGAHASALIVADRSSPLGGVAAGLLRPASGGSPFVMSTHGSTPMLDFQLEPSRLPANWLGYTSLRAVVIGPQEWAALDDAQRGALLTWTACGGDLILAADADMPLAGGGHRAPDARPGGEPRKYFFGRIHRYPIASMMPARLQSVISDTEKWQDAHWALPVNRALSWNVIDVHGFRLAIPGVSGIPTRAYLSILVVFSVLIGPVNYWLLWRRRRLVLFVLTAPVISALFIVFLAGYVVAAEGFHVSGRAVTFTMLDQARKQAVTRGSSSLYAAGMTPGGGLRFPSDVAVYPLGTDGEGSRDALNLDLTETQQFTSGVIQARTPTNLEEVAFRQARERLTFDRDASGVRVVNGLGATVRKLIFKSGGQIYSLDAPLAEGATATLKAGAIVVEDFLPRDVPMPPRFRVLVDSQPEGSYLAVLDRSPFWEPGVTGVIERGSFHLVLGLPDGQPGQPGQP